MTQPNGDVEELLGQRGMSLADAKAAVHLSAAWSDLRERTDRFHEDLEQVASESGAHEKKAPSA
jgi:hypothetical protein